MAKDYELVGSGHLMENPNSKLKAMKKPDFEKVKGLRLMVFVSRVTPNACTIPDNMLVPVRQQA